MSLNPFEIIDPFSQKDKNSISTYDSKKKNESKNESKNEFIQKFIQIIQDKDKETLLEINQLLIKKLEELK
tara:strand:- start:257 stop:469 length:213 start_codon:yes stop_codon:yes gene_type:complete